MNQATRSAGLGLAFCLVLWLCTGIWQFAAVAAIGMAFTWVTTPPARPQPRRRVRDFVRLEIRNQAELVRQAAIDHEAAYDAYRMACYDYGGCQWRGDGVKGQPLVLGPSIGCPHTPTLSVGKRVPDHRAGCTEDGCEGECRPHYQGK